MKNSISKYLRYALLALFVLVQSCASTSKPKEVAHSFAFDGYADKWVQTVDLLAYDYGGKYHMVRDSLDSERSRLFRRTESVPPTTRIQGDMPIGEFLYVKWRIKATGQVREERVDLRPLMPSPKDLRDATVTFVIYDRQLYVYIVTPKGNGYTRGKPMPKPPRPSDELINLTFEIYPANTYPKQ